MLTYSLLKQLNFRFRYQMTVSINRLYPRTIDFRYRTVNIGGVFFKLEDYRCWEGGGYIVMAQ